MLRWSLCHYIDAYTLVSEAVTISGAEEGEPIYLLNVHTK